MSPIDLNRFSIVGPNACTRNPTRCTFANGGMGIQADAPAGVASPENVRVMNGTITGLGGTAVRVLGDGGLVERVHAIDSGGSRFILGDGMVLDSVSQTNGSGTAVIATMVRGCLVSHGFGVGIGVRPGGIVSGNTSRYNGGMGFSLQAGASVTGNSAINNAGA